MLKDGVFTAEDDITEALSDGRTILLLAKGLSVSEAMARKYGFIKDGSVGPSEVKAEPADAPQIVTPPTESPATGEVAGDQVLPIGANATNPRARQRLRGS